ncbi:MAG: hypothetical protein JW841_04440 [Deltaproteobacteria bacterium]|nr:hypothetical protein [Deltaproteobacteria bacterium]
MTKVSHCQQQYLCLRFLSAYIDGLFFIVTIGIHIARYYYKMFCAVVPCLSFLSGCLLPPDADYVEPKNQPPRITRPDPNPTLDFVIHGCGFSRTYAASIFDPDSIDLYWRVFVDYQRDDNQEPQNGSSETGARVSFEIQDSDPRFRGGTSVAHVVELMVADQPFDAPTGRSLPEEAGSVSLTWTVQYVTSDQCE